MGGMRMMTAPWQRQGLGWITTNFFFVFWDTQRREKGGGMDDRNIRLDINRWGEVYIGT